MIIRKIAQRVLRERKNGEEDKEKNVKKENLLKGYKRGEGKKKRS